MDIMDELVDYLNQYTPKEIIAGIDVRQGEIESIISETNEISKENHDNEKEETHISE